MNWAGITIALGLACLGAGAGWFGGVMLVLGALWLWRRG